MSSCLRKFFVENRNVVYIGGLGGIGAGTCSALIREGIANLYILDLMENDDQIKKFKEQNPKCNVFYLKFDITKDCDINRCFAKVIADIKYIDVLINGCGICDDSDVDKEIAVNLTGLIKTTIKAFDLMDKNKKGRGGVIVNISSIAGLKSMKGKAVYCATKHGVVGFSRSLGCDYYHKITGISVLCVCPGFTITPMANVENFTKGTFEYSSEICKEVLTEKPQTAEKLGYLICKIIEDNKNGSIWLCRIGSKEEVILGEYEEPKDI